MRERPILMNGEMVRATLEGRKGQTRRLVMATSNDGRHTLGDEWRFVSDRSSAMGQRCYERGEWLWQHRTNIRRLLVERCPYGRVGDRLRVRETWGFDAKVTADSHDRWLRERDASHIVYRADNGASADRWRPSIHMPMFASRITLEVTGVRVERLQSITEDDARAEGVTVPPCACCVRADGRVVNCTHGPSGGCCPCCLDTREGCYIEHFVGLWDRINGKRAAWASNPWVWVLEFRRVEVNHA